jgi:hypothetical protein
VTRGEEFEQLRPLFSIAYRLLGSSNPDQLGHGGGRLGGRPRGEPGSPAHGLTGRANCAADLYE